MSDIEKIDALLKEIAAYFKVEAPLSRNQIYSKLVRMSNANPNSIEYLRDEFSGYEEDLRSIYKDTGSIFHYNDFLACNYKKTDYDNHTDIIKMYIPLDKEHMARSIHEIFSFLEQNKIEHFSKVSDKVRFDDLVIRVKNMGDAAKLQRFIQKNEYIKEGMIAPNPFAVSAGGISYAWDDEINYNGALADYITNYMNTKYTYGGLDDVSYEDFFSYLNGVYNQVFVNNIDREGYMASMSFKDNTDALFNNYKRVTEFIRIGMSPNKSMDAFYHKYGEIQTEKLRKWMQAYDGIINKYGYNYANKIVNSYIADGDTFRFTRKSYSEDTIISPRQIVSDNKITPEYLNELIYKQTMIENAIYETLRKYDEEQVYSALFAGNKGNFQYFTHASNRTYLSRNVAPTELYEIMRLTFMQNGYTLDSIPKDENGFYEEYLKILTSREKENKKVGGR